MGSAAYAQTEGQAIPPPERKLLFREDSSKAKKIRSQQTKSVLATDKPASQELDFKGDKVEFLRESNQVKGLGNVLVSRQGLQVQANEAVVDMTSKDADLKGDVLVNHAGGILSADSAKFNLDAETGEFVNSEFTLEDGNYNVSADKAEKVSDLKYHLFGANFSTCQCEDDYKPWSISTQEAHITQEGYAHTYNTALRLFSVPCLYAPYFAFPVKQERQSGLLVPSYSFSDEDGFGLKLPIFVALDDSSDLTVSPFFQTETRRGGALEYRQAFSRYNSMSAQLLYSDESPRDGDLRGTLVSDLYDPEIDDDRIGAAYTQIWRSSPEADIPIDFISDMHYVSDDLFPREMELEKISPHDARFVTSTAILRGTLGDSALLELSSEYNQSILTDDDLVFQRLPELNLTTSRSDRPFGFNPYGLKLVSGLQANVTNFSREEGYDGMRSDLNPTLRMPFHIKNYLASEVSVGLRQTWYDLDQTGIPDTEAELDQSNDRGLANLNFGTSSALERVYQLDPGNSLTYLTSLGSENQATELRRVKHVIEPYMRYLYVPDVDQTDLPQFDSLDRIKEKSLFVLGTRTSLLGRFLPKGASSEQISELTPRVEDLPVLQRSQALPDLGMFDQFGEGSYSNRQGEVREIAYLSLKQTYDYKEDKENNDPLVSSWSDTYMELGLSPSPNFLFNIQSNYDFQSSNPGSWAIATSFFDDRRDALRARYSYVEESLSQVEGNLELTLAERLKFGYYARYDEQESEFIENKLALRLASACDCWYLDLGLSDKINPDRQQVFLTFTFGGLGDITQSFGMGQSDSQ